MSVTPTEYDLQIYTGADFYVTFTFYDSSDSKLDITEWIVEAQMRSTYTAEDALATFTVVKNNDDSEITISLTASGTGELELNTELDLSTSTTASNAVWDLVVTTASGAGYREPYIRGSVDIYGIATRS